MPKKFRDMPDWAKNRKARENVYRDERGEEWDRIESNARSEVTSVPPEEEFRDPNTPTNEQRSGWANEALRAFGQAVGVDTCETNVNDLINDLAHWCDRHGVDLWECWQGAAASYHEETNGKGVQFHAK
jgi:hypothetical protein